MGNVICLQLATIMIQGAVAQVVNGVVYGVNHKLVKVQFLAMFEVCSGVETEYSCQFILFIGIHLLIPTFILT